MKAGIRDHQGLPANLQKLGESPWNRSSQPSEGTDPNDTLISQPSRLQDCETINYLSKTTKQKQLKQKELQQKYPFLNILTEYFNFKREKMIEGRRGCLLLHGINLILFFSPHLPPYVDQIPTD